MAYQHPFPTSTITSRFGATAGRPNAHRGVDYAPGGPPAPSIVNGTVVTSTYQSGLGNVVVVKNDIDGYYIGYSHLASRSVSVGQRVGVGTAVGIVGNTGTLSNGRHLHFTVSPSSSQPWTGAVIDPVAYIGSGSSTAGGGASTSGLSTDTQKKYQQYLSNLKRYDGLIDGAWGPKSWAAIQQHLKDSGLYPGVVDGVPGINTMKGLQGVAKLGGYGGPIDGVWGPNSDAGLNKWLTTQLTAKPTPAPGEFGDPIPAATQKSFQTLLTRQKLYSGLIDGKWGEMSWKAIQTYMSKVGVYTGPADGVPGTNTYKGLQGLAAKGGYKGPIDGIMGPKSNEGLATYLNAELAKGTGGIPVEPPPATAPGIPTLPSSQIFGIDIGSSQAGIDLSKFASNGGKFVIAKMGGGNASDSPYTSPHYATQVAAARVAKLKVGHYWMNGDKNGLTPEKAAQYFAKNALIVEGDIVALDIESIDGVTAYTPEQAMAWVKELQKTFPGIKVFFYMSSSVVRAGDWKAAAAAGHPLWVAAYNSNDGTTKGGEPNIDDWTTWAIWQYASQVARVPGWGGNIDMNIARSDIFTKYAWKKPVTPTPEPEPEPITDWKAEFKKLYEAQGNVQASFADEYAKAKK